MQNVSLRTSSVDFYDSSLLRNITGLTIRPGGLALTDRAVGFCIFAEGAKLLDVGCGVGATVEHLNNRYCFDTGGVDISVESIAEGLRRNPLLKLTEATAEALPFDDASQDGILCECVLSLLEQPEKSLGEFRRVLRSGGYLILSDLYNRGFAKQGCYGDWCTEGATPSQIESLLSHNGFQTLLWEDHTLLLKELAARLILAHGNLDGFCCKTGTCGNLAGYYLLVARRN